MVTEDEIRMMVDLGEEKGAIDADEQAVDPKRVRVRRHHRAGMP